MGAAALAIVGVAAGTLVRPASAAADPPALSRLIAYVRSGDLYVSKGATERRLTVGGGWSRPRFSPDGTTIAVLRAGQLWTMKADGSGKRRITTRPAAGPSWSPDGRFIAFASQSCTGGPGVFRIAAARAGAVPQALFPAECRGQQPPADPVAGTPSTGTLAERLRYDDAVAWSPDGTMIAFRGGTCESIYDACLTVGTVATGAERILAAFGGGSLQNSGFAVLPSWRPDGARLAWTTWQRGETPAADEPVHVVEYDFATRTKRDLGLRNDRELVYLNQARAALTGSYHRGSWVLLLDLTTGARTPFHPGSQPSVQPAR
jgi:Tol biopolymer transport system component